MNQIFTIKTNEHKKILDFFDISSDLEKEIIINLEAQAEIRFDLGIVNLTKNKLNLKLEINHFGEKSISHVKVHALVLGEGESSIDVTTSVKRGSIDSEGRQKIKVLTLSDKMNVNATPILDIEENKIATSHHCSMGTINEELLQYLNAKGISKKEAIILFANSFFESFLQDDPLEKEKKLKKVIEAIESN